MDQMSSVSVHTIAQFNRIRQHAAYAPDDTIVEMIVEACTSSPRLQVLEVILGSPPVVADYRISSVAASLDGGDVTSGNELPGPPLAPPVVPGGSNQWTDHMYPVSYMPSMLYFAP